MMRILVPSAGPGDWKCLLAQPEHWARGKSARTLAHCWEDCEGFPAEVGAVFKQAEALQNIEPLLALPEWKVPLPGSGRPSQNDIWVLAKTTTPHELVSIAVEGKVDEPFGQTLEEWNKDASTNKQKRLEYLLSCFGIKLPGHIHYQLVHRAASAVIEAERFGARAAVMLVHSFSHTDQSQGFEEYSEFCRLFGIEAKIGVLGRTSARGKLPLHLGWVRGDERYLSS